MARRAKKKKRSTLSMSDKITIMAVIVDIIIVLIEIALHFF
ncbi:hypothetical protein [Streptococcus suis]|nr:hypothetical protein [Streptococcus suis]